MSGRIARRFSQRGTIPLLAMLLLPVMLAFVGFAIDIGNALKTRRELQTVADAGALAATFGAQRGLTGTNLDDAIVDSLAKNDDSCTWTKSTDNTSALCTWSAAQVTTGYQVRVNKRVNTYFLGPASSFLNFNMPLLIPTASSTAGASFGYCIVALNVESKKEIFKVEDSSTLNAPTCGVFVNGEIDSSKKNKEAVKFGKNVTINISSLELEDDSCVACTKTNKKSNSVKIFGRILLNQPHLDDPLYSPDPTKPRFNPTLNLTFTAGNTDKTINNAITTINYNDYNTWNVKNLNIKNSTVTFSPYGNPYKAEKITIDNSNVTLNTDSAQSTTFNSKTDIVIQNNSTVNGDTVTLLAKGIISVNNSKLNLNQNNGSFVLFGANEMLIDGTSTVKGKSVTFHVNRDTKDDKGRIRLDVSDGYTVQLSAPPKTHSTYGEILFYGGRAAIKRLSRN